MNDVELKFAIESILGIHRGACGDNFKRSVQEAIDNGYAEDACPTWYLSSDYYAAPVARLTPTGEIAARRFGFVCKCADCNAISLGLCSYCHGAAVIGGVYDNCCAHHYFQKHPELEEARLRCYRYRGEGWQSIHRAGWLKPVPELKEVA